MAARELDVLKKGRWRNDTKAQWANSQLLIEVQHYDSLNRVNLQPFLPQHACKIQRNERNSNESSITSSPSSLPLILISILGERRGTRQVQVGRYRAGEVEQRILSVFLCLDNGGLESDSLGLADEFLDSQAQSVQAKYDCGGREGRRHEHGVITHFPSYDSLP